MRRQQRKGSGISKCGFQPEKEDIVRISWMRTCEVTIEFGLSVDGGGERVNNVFELELITFRISVLSGILT